MTKTTVLLDFGSGPSEVVGPMTAYVRPAAQFQSGNKTILPGPGPVPLDRAGRATVQLDPGQVWEFRVSAPSYITTPSYRVVPESATPLLYADLVEVAAPPRSTDGVPQWAADVIEAREQTAALVTEVGTAAANATSASLQAQELVASIQANGAYQVWLAEGNEGTEAEFLASLEGRSAYESWLAQGNTGTEADFLAWLRATDAPAKATDAVLVVDLTARRATRAGLSAPYAAAITEPAPYQRDATGCLVWQRGTTNMLPNAAMGGGALGIITTGTGVLPTGWAITTSASGTLAYEIQYLANNTMRVRATRAANATAISGAFGIRHPNTPGVQLPAPSRGGYAASVTASIIGTPTPNVRNLKLVQTVRTVSTGTQVAEPNLILLPGAARQRLAVFYPMVAGQSVSLGVNIELTGPTTDPIDVTFEISMPQVEDAASAFDVTAFTATTRAAGAVTLPLPAGDYSLLFQGPRGGTWRDVSVVGTAGYGIAEPTTGSVPVAKLYAYNRLTAAEKNAVTQEIDPIEYAAPRWLNLQGDRLFAGDKLYYRAAPLTEYAITAAANRRSVTRHEIRPGEMSPNSTNANQRSELVRTPWGSEVITMPFGQRVWCAFSLRIEDLPNDRDWMILGQWHQTEDANEGPFSPLLHLNYTKEGEMQIVARSSSASPTTQASIITTTPYRDPAYPRGGWVPWVFGIEFSKTGGGYLEAYQGGRQVFNGPCPIGYNDAVGPYFQYGIYAPPSDATTSVVHWANVETSTTSLLDRVANPLPIAGALPTANAAAAPRVITTPSGIVLMAQADYDLLSAAEKAAITAGIAA